MLIDKTMSTMNHHLENIKLYLSTKGYTSFDDFVMDLRTSLEERSLTLANSNQVPGMLQPPAEANMTTQQPRNKARGCTGRGGDKSHGVKSKPWTRQKGNGDGRWTRDQKPPKGNADRKRRPKSDEDGYRNKDVHCWVCGKNHYARECPERKMAPPHKRRNNNPESNNVEVGYSMGDAMTSFVMPAKGVPSRV
jgi:hypothetical protein